MEEKNQGNTPDHEATQGVAGLNDVEEIKSMLAKIMVSLEIGVKERQTLKKQLSSIQDHAEVARRGTVMLQQKAIHEINNTRRSTGFLKRSYFNAIAVPGKIVKDLGKAEEEVTTACSQLMRQGPRATLNYYLVYAKGGIGMTIELILFALIIIACVMFILESPPNDYENPEIEFFLTTVFTIEYILRVYAVTDRVMYIFSFYGIIDLLAIIPTYFEILLDAGEANMSFLRSLRVLRVAKLIGVCIHPENTADQEEGQGQDIYIFGVKIGVRAFQMGFKIFKGLLTMAIIWFVGAGVFIFIEPDTVEDFFECYYFMVVSATTVGYGDISPVTRSGQAVMIAVLLGFLIYVPILVRQVSEAYDAFQEDAFMRAQEQKEQEIGTFERNMSLSLKFGLTE